jgi:hypothetical protein
MTKTITGSAAVLLVAAFSLLANPATAQQTGSAPSNAVCFEDVICVDTSVVRTWPLERWSQVRRQTKQETATARPGTPTPVAR